jgi:glucose/arabinose dehydrogenase
MVYSGKLFPQWKGDLFIGGLSSLALIRVDVDGTTPRRAISGRWVRASASPKRGPDGAIWLLEDGQRGAQGRLLKLTPAPPPARPGPAARTQAKLIQTKLLSLEMLSTGGA